MNNGLFGNYSAAPAGEEKPKFDRKAYFAEYRRTHRAQRNAKQAEYYRAHIETEKARTSAYYRAHIEDAKAYRAQHYQDNKDKDKARQAEYDRLHPEVQREAKHKRRALLRESFVAPVSAQEIYDRDKGICQICRKAVSREKASLDHIVPVSLGGIHAPWNVQIAHRSCNSRRGPGRIPAQMRLPLEAT